MENMNIILSLDGYSIYENDNYYLCIPNENCSFYHVFMGFSLKDLNNISREDLFMEIRKISDSIHAVYKNAIYILPIIKPSFLKDASIENDDREYNRILKNFIQPITLSVYSKLVAQNKRISQIIKMIKQNDVDKKFIGWLSMKLGNDFIKEITFDEQADNDNQKDNDYDILSNSKTEIMSIDYQIDDIWIKKQEDSISETLKPAVSPGFSAMKFLLMVLSIFLVLGSIIGYLIIK